MKKSVVIAIGIIYAVAIVLVGLLGSQMHVYDPTIYATKISCLSENYREYPELKDGCNGIISYNSFTEGMKVELKCVITEPNNVSNKDITYTLPSSIDFVKVTKYPDATAYLTFSKAGSVYVSVTAADNHGAKMKIKVVVIDLGDII